MIGGRLWKWLFTVFVLVATNGMTRPCSGSGDEVRAKSKPSQNGPAAGKVIAADRFSVPGFNLRSNGVFEWPNKLRLSRGPDGGGFGPQGEFIRAQPGGNIVLEPQGDYKRCALDLLPTRGKLPDVDAIAEFTIHRMHPSRTNQVLNAEMISYTALGTKPNHYAVVVEAHGKGELKPLTFMVVKGGLNQGEESFVAEAMRVTEHGTVALGLLRQGGPLKRPVDSISLGQPDPVAPGTYDSDYLQWVGKSHDGTAIHVAHWRAHVKVTSNAADSKLVIENRIDGAGYTKRLEVTDRGDVELSSPGSAVIVRSPNGSRWRITVDDNGTLATKSATSARE
ncbi:MAG: hypothetical protein ACC628_12445 [Pirellulaceae bacterium]